MKHLFVKSTLTLALLLLLSNISYAQKKVVASNNIISKEVPIEQYEAIDVTGIPTVTYSQSNSSKAKLRIMAPDNIMDLLVCEVKNGVLSVNMKPGYTLTITNSKTKLHIYTSSSTINRLSVKGSGDIMVTDPINTQKLLLQVNGSGDITCNKVICKESLQSVVNGSGDISLTQAETNQVSLTVNGSGDCTVQNIISNQGSFTVNGSGNVAINKADIKNQISATVNGSGDLEINKTAVCNALTADVNGSGDMSIEGIKAVSIKGGVSGSGDLRLSGNSKNAKLNLRNSGEISATSLLADDVTASVVGSGNIKCNAKKSLVSNISGNGGVYYKGNAKVTNETKKQAKRM